MDGGEVDAWFSYYVTDQRGIDLALFKQINHDMVELEGLWDPEPQYDTSHPDFVAAFNAADTNSDGLISRDEASAWFGVTADSMDDFWQHYVTN